VRADEDRPRVAAMRVYRDTELVEWRKAIGREVGQIDF
jgi:hypothetical protein